MPRHNLALVNMPMLFGGTYHRALFFCICMYVLGAGYVCMVITYSKSMDQPGKVANPARGQLNREDEYFPLPVRV